MNDRRLAFVLLAAPLFLEPSWRIDDEQGLVLGGVLAAILLLAMTWLVYVNIRRRRRAEQTLLKTQDEWQQMLQAIGHPMLILSPESRIIAANRAAAEAAGIPVEQMLGQPCCRIFHQTDTAPATCPFAAMRASGRMETSEMEVEGPPESGQDVGRVYLVSCTPLLDELGRLARVIHIATDVTGHKRTERALRHSEARLQSIFRAAPTGIGVVSNRVVTEINDKITEIVGYSREEMVGQSARLVYPSDEEYEYVGREKYAQISARGTGTVETRWQHKNGQIMDILLSSTPIDPGHLEVGVTFTALDITARKETERALQASREEMRILIDSIDDIVYTLDCQQRYTRVFGRWIERLGLLPEVFIGKTAQEILGPERAVVHEQANRRALDGQNAVYEWSVVDAQGALRYYQTLVSPLRDGAGRLVGLVGVGRDVTERRYAEMALQESEVRYRTLVEEAHDIIYTQGLDGTVTSLNPAFEATTGWSAVEWLGRFFDSGIHPDDLPRATQIFQACIQGQAPPMLEVRFLTKWDEYRTLEFRVKPLIQDGQIRGVLGTARDMTERIQAEQEIRRLNAELEQRVAQRTIELQAKTLELESFAYSVSHDLKAPLRAIDGYSQLLLQEHIDQLDLEGQRFFRNIRRAVGQMDQLINDLLAYSRFERSVFSSGRMDLGELVGRLIAERADEIQERKIELIVEVPPSGEWVVADMEGLAQAVRNLLDNAIKFTRDVPNPKIQVGRRKTENQCILWVRDNGIGFDMAYHHRLFEIFERLHRAEEYPGTGIGLAMVRKAMQRIGGRVWAESTPGAGATFYLEMPRAIDEPTEALA